MNNRSLKFRIWDKEFKQSGGFRYLSLIDAINWLNNGDVFTGDFDLEKIQQFTGLLDKNGKEIYEGDIVEVIYYKYNKNGDSYDWKSGKVPQFFQVEFDKEQYEGSYTPFSSAFDSEHGSLEYQAKNTRIVGNIFENPNLCPKT
jgi:uncharacterized phage protein (TIGR01671 family)